MTGIAKAVMLPLALLSLVAPQAAPASERTDGGLLRANSSCAVAGARDAADTYTVTYHEAGDPALTLTYCNRLRAGTEANGCSAWGSHRIPTERGTIWLHVRTYQGAPEVIEVRRAPEGLLASPSAIELEDGTCGDIGFFHPLG